MTWLLWKALLNDNVSVVHLPRLKDFKADVAPRLSSAICLNRLLAEEI